MMRVRRTQNYCGRVWRGRASAIGSDRPLDEEWGGVRPRCTVLSCECHMAVAVSAAAAVSSAAPAASPS